MVSLGLACITLFWAVCGVSSKCVPPVGHYANKTMEELMVRSAIVVYGKNTGPAHDNTTVGVVAHSFAVYCVFKSDGKPVKDNIFILVNHPPADCSVSILPDSKNAIVGLKRSNSENYTFDEPSMSQSAVFEATDDNYFRVKKICQLADWMGPDQGTDMCPTNINPGFCTNYTLPSLGLKAESCTWVLFASLLVIIASMLIGQSM